MAQPLQGADRTAAEAWARAAPDLPQPLRDEMEAGLIGNGVHVYVANAVNNPSSATWERDVRDCARPPGSTCAPSRTSSWRG